MIYFLSDQQMNVIHHGLQYWVQRQEKLTFRDGIKRNPPFRSSSLTRICNIKLHLQQWYRGKRDPQPAARLYRVEGGQESLEQGSSKAFIFVPARFQQSPYVEKERCPGASNKTLSSPPTSTNAVALHECCKGKWDERKQKGEEDKEHGPQMLL